MGTTAASAARTTREPDAPGESSASGGARVSTDPQSPGPRRRRWWPWAAGGVLVVALVAGVLALRPTPSAAPGPLVLKDATFLDAEHPGVLGFENGDCFEDPEIAAARGEDMLVTVECVGAQNEVVQFVGLSDLTTWDQEAVRTAADERCTTAVAESLGDVAPAGYAVYGVPPTAQTWSDGDRDVMCVLYRPGESFTVEPLADVVAGQD